MTATTELIAEARRLVADCRTYNFGMYNADRLAHVVAGQLADALETAAAVQQPNRDAMRRAIEGTEVWRVFGFNIEPVLDAVLAALAVPATPRNLVTPCHGMPLTILTRTEGSGHLTTDVPDEIVCPADHCFNSWDANGVADEYNKEVTP